MYTNAVLKANEFLIPVVSNCSWSITRPALIRGMAFTSSMSNEEISHDHITVEAADSGRGSWTSCSSSSHDNFQNIPNQKSWDLLNSYRHTQLDGPIAEVDPTNCYSEEAYLYSEAFSKNNRQSKASVEHDQSRQSWASSSSLSDTYETNYGTIKRRGLENSTSEQTEVLDSKPGTDTTYKTVTSSTEKGLIGKPSQRLVEASTSVLHCDIKLLRNDISRSGGWIAC